VRVTRACPALNPFASDCCFLLLTAIGCISTVLRIANDSCIASRAVGARRVLWKCCGQCHLLNGEGLEDDRTPDSDVRSRSHSEDLILVDRIQVEVLDPLLQAPWP